MVKIEEKQITTEVNSRYCDFCGDLVEEIGFFGKDDYSKVHRSNIELENIEIIFNQFHHSITSSLIRFNDNNVLCDKCSSKLLSAIKDSIKQIVEDMKIKEEEPNGK